MRLVVPHDVVVHSPGYRGARSREVANLLPSALDVVLPTINATDLARMLPRLNKDLVKLVVYVSKLSTDGFATLLAWLRTHPSCVDLTLLNFRGVARREVELGAVAGLRLERLAVAGYLRDSELAAVAAQVARHPTLKCLSLRVSGCAYTALGEALATNVTLTRLVVNNAPGVTRPLVDALTPSARLSGVRRNLTLKELVVGRSYSGAADPASWLSLRRHPSLANLHVLGAELVDARARARALARRAAAELALVLCSGDSPSYLPLCGFYLNTDGDHAMKTTLRDLAYELIVT